MFSLEKRRLTGDLTTVFNYLMGEYRGDRARLYTHGERTRYTRHKLQLRKFLLDLSKILSPSGQSNSGAGAQRGGFSIFGDTQNPAGQRPEQLDLV